MSASTPTTSSLPLFSTLLPNLRPIGFRFAKYFLTAASLTIATNGAPSTSRDVKPRPTRTGIFIASKKLADTIYSQLKSGGDFAALAKKYSKDPGSAAQGGKLTISRGQTVAPFDKTAFALKTGELSPPIKTQYGWHIIQAMSAVKKAKQTSLAQVKESIRQQLLQQKKNDAMSKWVDTTKKDFCKGKLAYGAGYKPLTDPCVALTSSTATATTGAATTATATTTSSTSTSSK